MAEIVKLENRRRQQTSGAPPAVITRSIDGMQVEYINFDALSDAERCALMDEEPPHLRGVPSL
jgi:hypothetical protein